jgi:hypothetical protein
LQLVVETLETQAEAERVRVLNKQLAALFDLFGRSGFD